MKNIKLYFNKIFSDLYLLEIIEFVLLITIIIIIPIWWRGSVLCMGLLFVNFIIKSILYKQIGNNYNRLAQLGIVSFIILYLLYVTSTIYSDNQSIAWQSIGQRLSLLLFPIFFLLSDLSYINKKRFKILCYSFVLGCLSIFLYCTFRTLKLSFGGCYLPYVFNWELPSQHHTYCSMYYLLALAFVYYELVNNWKIWSGKRKMAMIGIGLSMMMLVVCVQSRSGVLCLVLLVLWWMFQLIFKYRLYKVGLLLGFISIGGILLTGNLLGERFNRLSQTVAEVADQDKSDIRYEIWGNAIGVIKANPILGVGVGDRIDELDENHLEQYGSNEGWRHFNPHNQFLDTWVAVGIGGFLCLVAIFVLPIIYALKQRPRNELLIVFIFIVGVAGLVESILERQMGLIFFTFFYGLLMLPINEEKKRYKPILCK